MNGKKLLGKEQPETLSKSLVLKNWLNVFSAHYLKEITPDNARAYALGLGDLTAAEIESACLAALRNPDCKFKMPTVADIRAQLKAKEELGTDLVAQSEWEAALMCAEQYNPDTGATSPQAVDWQNRPAWLRQPGLSAAGEHGVRCAGGWAALYAAHFEPDKAVWARKEFLAGYKAHSEGQRLGLTECDTKKLLGKVQEAAKRLEAGKE